MKIKVVANKTWEADPLISALLNPEAQNFTAAFNAGIYVSYVLANLVGLG